MWGGNGIGIGSGFYFVDMIVVFEDFRVLRVLRVLILRGWDG